MKNKIKRYLCANCIGKQNATPISKIIEDIGEEQTGLTNPHARTTIKALTREGIAIGSCTFGFFIINTIEELNEYLENLKFRSLKIQQRMKLVEKAFYNRR